MKRGPRGSQPRAYLGLRWLVEAAPREGVADGVPRWRCSGAAVLEGSGEGVRLLWRCEAG
jgi:hypothetical protein